MRNKYLFLFVMIVVIASGLYFFILGDEREGGQTERAEKKRYIKSVYASGYVDSVNKVLIKPEVSGYIDRVYVSEGERVSEGQLLAVVRNDKLEQNLREIEARKELTEKRLKEDSDYILSLEDEVEIRKLNLDIERKNFERRKSLFKKGIISKESYDQAGQSLGIAERNHDRAVKNLNDALSSLKTELKTLTAQEKAVLEEVEKHRIRSPVIGEVLRKFTEEGDYVNNMIQGNELFSVGDHEKLETVLLVDEEYLPLIKIGQKVLVTTDAYPDKVFEGKVTLIERESDRKSRTVKVKADVDYPGNIPVGITIEANIVVVDKEGLFISKDTVKNGYIKIISNGEEVETPVKTGIEKGNFLEIEDGVRENQEIITR